LSLPSVEVGQLQSSRSWHSILAARELKYPHLRGLVALVLAFKKRVMSEKQIGKIASGPIFILRRLFGAHFVRMHGFVKRQAF
jgi:hypothetical protein